MEFVLLGLLALRPMSLYELNKILERSISLFYSASFGSLNATLSRMLENGWVTAEQRVEKGRNKKIFSLTDAGQQAFQGWLVSAIPAEKVKEPALTRLFFMGMMPAADRLRVLETHLNHLRQTQAALDVLFQQASAVQVEARLEEVAEFQRYTLAFGRDYYAFNIQWYENLLDQLREGQKS
ncbi:MAG: PadR family transcriptional regulator [Anaerolineae bacterium]|nr:PadR family transcriptional regulator [Anaerolineae bacterium]